MKHNEIQVTVDKKRQYLVDEESGKQYPISYTVNPFKLDRELCKWVEHYKENISLGLERPKMSDYLGLSIMKIANGISSRHNFIGYTFKEEMISDAYEHVIKYIHNYKSSSETQSGYPPAYSYIYLMCWRSFTNRIKHEEEEQIKKYLSLEALGGMDAFNNDDTFDYNEEERASSNTLYTDYMNKIHEYESRMKNKKKEIEIVEVEEELEPTVKDDFLLSFME